MTEIATKIWTLGSAPVQEREGMFEKIQLKQGWLGGPDNDIWKHSEGAEGERKRHAIRTNQIEFSC